MCGPDCVLVIWASAQGVVVVSGRVRGSHGLSDSIVGAAQTPERCSTMTTRRPSWSPSSTAAAAVRVATARTSHDRPGSIVVRAATTTSSRSSGLITRGSSAAGTRCEVPEANTGPRRDSVDGAAPPQHNHSSGSLPSAAVTTSTSTTPATSRALLNKVPEVTVWFWVIKILCTTVGESLADCINATLGFGLNGTSVLFTVLLGVALVFQFRTRRYVPAVYWLAVVLVSVTGTLYTDILTDQAGVPLAVSSTVFTVLLVAVFGTWYARERTLSIHSITTAPREAFYWLTVLVTFALGTATGDWILELTGWSPGQSVLLPITLIGAVALGWRVGANPVLAFWLAYILTRPMGANLGDYLGQPTSAGGLGVGLFGTSAVFLVAIAAIVVYLTRTRVDVSSPAGTTATRPTTPTREWIVLAGWVVLASVAAVIVGTAATTNAGAGAALAETAAPVATLAPGQRATAFTTTDLAPFTTITQDMLGQAKASRQDQLQNRAGDLESAWDDAVPTLQAKNPGGWTTLDGKIDTVLKRVRTSSPDPAGQTAAITELQTALAE